MFGNSFYFLRSHGEQTSFVCHTLSIRIERFSPLSITVDSTTNQFLSRLCSVKVAGLIRAAPLIFLVSNPSFFFLSSLSNILYVSSSYQFTYIISQIICATNIAICSSLNYSVLSYIQYEFENNITACANSNESTTVRESWAKSGDSYRNNAIKGDKE